MKNKTAKIYKELLMMDVTEVTNVVRAIKFEIRNYPVTKKLLGIAVVLLQLLQKYGLSHINVLSEAQNLIDADKDNKLGDKTNG